jgi:hypothetical protein
MVATKPAARPHQPAFLISLRIRHPSIDPRAISQELSIDAEHAFMAGEPRESASGIASASVHAESCWLATLNPSAWLTRNLSNSIALCTTHLAARSEFLQKLHREGAQMVMRVALSPLAMEDFSLSPQTTGALGKLGITVEFDFADPD